MYRCAACTSSLTTFDSVDELEVHIAADHVNYVPFECEKCRFSKFPTEFALISHCTNDHGLKDFYVKYKVTPDTDRKRQEVQELLQKSVSLSTATLTFVRHAKRKRATVAADLMHSSAISPSSSIESEDVHTPGEVDKCLKTEDSAKDDVAEAEDISERVHNQHVVVAASGEITLSTSNNYPPTFNITDVFPSDGGSLFDVQSMKAFDAISDLSQSFMPQENTSSNSTQKTRRRPPRTCIECGLQVTGQRSSLIYHANAKHLRLPLFHCRACNKTWSTVTKSDILKHVKAVHQGDDSHIDDYRSQYVEQIKEMTDKCFPPKHRGGNDEDENEQITTESCPVWMNADEQQIHNVSVVSLENVSQPSVDS